MGGGHYVAYARHWVNNEEQWYYFSDSHKREVTKAQVQKAQALMLFYKRVEQKEKLEEAFSRENEFLGRESFSKEKEFEEFLGGEVLEL